MDCRSKQRTHFVIAGFGNPLLDVCITINDNYILDKFHLLPDGQKEVAEVEMKAILHCLLGNGNSLSYFAGGAVQNTLRIIQQLVKTPSFTVFFGGCGQDELSKILLAQVKQSCVEARYAIQENKPTGTVISLINGHNRSLVAHLGAANIYTLGDLQSQDNLDVIANVNIVYIEGFFVSHSFNVAFQIVKICRQNGNILVFNISGAYLFEKYASEIATMVALADIVIGNRSEFLALSKFLKIQELPMKEILSTVKTFDYTLYVPNYEYFCQQKTYKLKQIIETGKIVICTDGENPVLAVHHNLNFVKVDVPHLAPSLIKDTTGAGDAFVAGFIVAFLKEKSLTSCLELGCEVAQRVIQTVGCCLPDDNK